MVFRAIVANPDAPALVEDKTRALYIVPCALREAPYISNTLERAKREGWPSMVGKQRSAAHCTNCAILKFDLDGMSAEQGAMVLETLKASGLAFVAYSTHSYGLKDGMRVRVFIPLDRELPQLEYELAWFGAAENLFSELIGLEGNILDESARKISQQQSVWCTAPSRAHLAFRQSVTGGAASADALITAGMAKHRAPPKRPGVWQARNAGLMPTPDIAQLTAAQQHTPDEYESWIKVGNCYKALVPLVGDDTAYDLWLGYSARGTHISKNDTAAYSPEAKWGTFAPSLPPDAAMGTLFAMARDGALGVIRAELATAVMSDVGRAAAQYLAKYHKKAFNELTGGVR